MKRILLLLATITLPLFGKMIYAGYVPTYRMSTISNYDYENLTHIFLSFGNPDSLGNISVKTNFIDRYDTTVVGSDTTIDTVHIFPHFTEDELASSDAIVDGFVGTVTSSGDTKPYLSIGGGGDYSWGPAVAIYEHLYADTNRTMFVNKIVQYLKDHNLSGVDVDIEGDALSHENYNVFTQELADSVHAAGLEVTAALGVSIWGGAAHITDETLQKFDLIMTMSYGGTWASDDQSDFTKYENDVNYFLNDRNIAPENVAGGIPFYAVEFRKTYHTLGQLFTKSEYEDQDPFYNDTIYASDNTPIFYNGWPTIKKKIDWADSVGTGIMIWELGQDNYGSGPSMTDTIAHYLNPTSPIAGRPVVETPKNQFNNNALVHIKVIDIRGRVIHSANSHGSFDINTIKQNLGTGIYFIRKVDINGIIQQEHFILR